MQTYQRLERLEHLGKDSKRHGGMGAWGIERAS